MRMSNADSHGGGMAAHPSNPGMFNPPSNPGGRSHPVLEAASKSSPTTLLSHTDMGLSGPNSPAQAYQSQSNPRASHAGEGWVPVKWPAMIA
jgi:hypothetical protein